MKKKWNGLMVVAIIFVLSFGTHVLAENERYYDEDAGFSIEIMENWLPVDIPGTDFALISPLESSEDQFRENYNIVTEDIPTNLNLNFTQYAELSIQNVKQYYNLLITGDSEIDGFPAKWVMYTQEYQGRKMVGLAYIILNQTKGYALTFTAEEHNFINYVSTFIEIAGSFRVE